MAEFRRGVGPNALPFGAATQLNRAQDFGELAMENTDIPVMFAKGEADAVPEPSGGDDLEILLDHPDPDYQTSIIPKERPGRIPRYTVRHLAQFRAAATSPDAPPGLRALYNATIRQLDEEQRRGS